MFHRKNYNAIKKGIRFRHPFHEAYTCDLACGVLGGPWGLQLELLLLPTAPEDRHQKVAAATIGPKAATHADRPGE